MQSSATTRRSRVEIGGIVAWFTLMVAVAGRFAWTADPARQNVWLKVFAPAARAFVDGRELYTEESGFRYPPIAAAAMLPFTWLGSIGGSIAWRWVWLACLGLAVRRAMRADFPFAMTSRERGATWLLVAVGVADGANIGQPNTGILGCMVFATVAAWQSRSCAAGIAIDCAAALKVYPLAHGLVLAVLRPRTVIPLAVGAAVVVALPFVLQQPSYVANQYAALFDLLRDEDRTGSPAQAYRDLRSLLASVGLPIHGRLWPVLQLVAGAAIAGLCRWLTVRRVEPIRVFEYALAFTVCWCLLFGPATERVTYGLLAPSLAWALLRAWRTVQWGPRAAWTSVAIAYFGDHLLPIPDRSYQADHPWVRQLPPLVTAVAATLLVMRACGDVRAARPRRVSPE